MTTHNELVEELKAKKEECILAGCTNGMLTKQEFELEKGEIMKCIDKIKSTMQTKSHFLWEIAKVIAIPVLTAILIFSALQTKVSMMETNLQKLESLVIQLIQDRR